MFNHGGRLSVRKVGLGPGASSVASRQELPRKRELFFPRTVLLVVIRPDAVGVHQAPVGDAS